MITRLRRTRSPSGAHQHSGVGLGILIHIATTTDDRNIVAKSSLIASCKNMPEIHKRNSTRMFSQLSFLKACFSCRGELNPKKDVYIYRGDMAFCSKECRFKQMAAEERREFVEEGRRRRVARASKASCMRPEEGTVTIWVGA